MQDETTTTNNSKKKGNAVVGPWKANTTRRNPATQGIGLIMIIINTVLATEYPSAWWVVSAIIFAGMLL